MADEQRVSQGGATVASALTDASEDRVSQGGATVASALVDRQPDNVSQGGATVGSSLTIRGFNRVSQGGAIVASCLVLYPAINIVAAINVDDIDLAWTNVQENAYVRITHSTDGVSYSTLVELDGAEVDYTHVAPSKALPHYYIFYAVDGLCISAGSSPVMTTFGGIYTYRVAFEAEPLTPGVYV